jgi:antitoxin component YwqK of YwqJK toxin-antitoxin module
MNPEIKKDSMGRVVSYFNGFTHWEKDYDKDGNLVYFTNHENIKWIAIYNDGKLHGMVFIDRSSNSTIKLEFDNDEVVSPRFNGTTEYYDSEGNVIASFTSKPKFSDKDDEDDESLELYDEYNDLMEQASLDATSFRRRGRYHKHA